VCGLAAGPSNDRVGDRSEVGDIQTEVHVVGRDEPVKQEKDLVALVLARLEDDKLGKCLRLVTNLPVLRVVENNDRSEGDRVAVGFDSSKPSFTIKN
jgi:hypothetical protein